MTAPRLSDRLQAVATALEDSDLTVLASVVVVEPLIDALEHAAALAAEVEHEADRASNLAGTNVNPAYPVLVRLLGMAVEVDQ